MLVGRASEQRAIAEVLDSARLGVGTGLVIRGEAGSGKSTLLDAARVRARDDGFTVLATRGRAADSHVAFAGLAGLLRPLESAFDELPDHLRPSLAAAVGVGTGRARATEVDWATYRLLVAATERSPLLLLVDDLLWLDSASWRAITFAATRMSGDAVALVAATRPTTGASFVDAGGFSLLELGGLDDEDLGDLVDPTGELAAGVVSGCRRCTGGNPLATIELVRSLDADQRAGRTALPTIPRPGDAIVRGFAWQLERLDGGARRALVVAAADDTGDVSVVARALHVLGEAPGSLDEAEAAHIIEMDSGRVAFTHPLLRAVAYHQVERSSRRAAHRALAASLDHVQQAEARAWHLAAGADGADETAAAALDLVASRASQRGAAAEAARTYERAAALSPSMAVRSRRIICGGRAWLAAGRAERAHCLIESQVAALDELDEGLALSAIVLLATAVRLIEGPTAAGSLTADAAARIGDGGVLPTTRILRALAADDLQRGGLQERAHALVGSVGGGGDWPAAMVCSVRGDAVTGTRPAPPTMLGSDILDRRLALRRAEQLLADGRPEDARVEVVELVHDGDPLDVGVLDLAACAARALDLLGRRSDARIELSALLDHVSGARSSGSAIAEALALDLQLTAEAESTPGVASPLDDLTPAEHRVAIAVGEGRTNRESAEVLFLSVKTIDYHLQAIYRKLGLRSRAELAVLVTRAEVGSR